MTTLISKFVTKTLCDHEGSLDFRELDEKLARCFTVAESVLREVLFDGEKFSVQEGVGPKGRGQLIPPDSLVVAKTSARLCQKKTGMCASCDGLHLCRYLVCGKCSYGQRCKNPHSLTSPDNAEVLRRHGLEDLTVKQLFQLLLQSDPGLLPEICSHYNQGTGPHGSCRFAASCTKLHVCLHSYLGDCAFGDSCRKRHHLDANAMKLLQSCSQENVGNVHKIYRNKLIIGGYVKAPAATPASPAPDVPTRPPSGRAPPPACPATARTPAAPPHTLSDAERNEICLFFIRRQCMLKERCGRVHWHLPYRWQVLDSDGVTYKDLPNMENIEKAYCDPARDASGDDQPSAGLGHSLWFRSSASAAKPGVDFLSMSCGAAPVRRLSTASSVSKPPHYIVTTQWVWYWKDDSGKWQEFGQSDYGTPATVTSQTLENVYLADRDTEIPFSAGSHQYVLHFRGRGEERMYQQNVKQKTRREVRRRPRFLSSAGVEAQLRSSSSQSSASSATETVPSNWDKSALPESGYRLVRLTPSVTEYSMIEALFKSTMPHSTVSSLQRIQNPSLWKAFELQKEQMKARNGGKLVEEKYLFHGTDNSLVEAICEQNFDWRVCGVHGTAYGKGSYFARDSSYANRYAKAKVGGLGHTIMFVALVLVGESTGGRSSYVRPPAKAGSRFLYDSCVDSVGNPSIYVIFEKQQIYPAYLIRYS